MSTTILENGWIKIDFSLGTDPFTFSDALHLPGDHGLSDAEIEAMKQSRYDNWLAIVNTPPSSSNVHRGRPTNRARANILKPIAHIT